MTAGHEVHIEESYLGEWIWGENGLDRSANLTATAIDMDGPYRWIFGVVVVGIFPPSTTTPKMRAIGIAVYWRAQRRSAWQSKSTATTPSNSWGATLT